MGKVSNCRTAHDVQSEQYRIQDWYNYPWDCVLRYNNAGVANMISNIAIDAANNDKIGYSQDKRYTFWEQLQKVNYDASLIDNECKADCSSSTCAIVKAVGTLKKIKELKAIPITTTYYMKDKFRYAGFEVLTDSKYLTSDKHLIKGDILLNINYHTCIYVGDAKHAPDSSLLENVKFSITIDKPIESTNVNILLVQNNKDKSGEQASGSFLLNGYRSTVYIATENVNNKTENRNNKNNSNKDDKIKEYEPYIYDGAKWQKYVITIMQEKEDKKKEERFRYIYNKIENNQGG